jgi:hypothetical protein
MSDRFTYLKNDENEVLVELGNIVQSLDDHERTILLQALVIQQFGPLLRRHDDLLHLMLWKDENDMCIAQLDRTGREDTKPKPHHLIKWRGVIEATDNGLTWRVPQPKP